MLAPTFSNQRFSYIFTQPVTHSCLCMAPSLASRLRRPDFLLQLHPGFTLVLPLPSPPCIPSSPRAYFSCVLSLAEALLTFPDVTEFPAEQGTYSATVRTGPGMRPMPGRRVSRPSFLEGPQSGRSIVDVFVVSVGSPVGPSRPSRGSSAASISAHDG